MAWPTNFFSNLNYHTSHIGNMALKLGCNLQAVKIPVSVCLWLSTAALLDCSSCVHSKQYWYYLELYSTILPEPQPKQAYTVVKTQLKLKVQTQFGV